MEGQVRVELTTGRLKARYSTTELPAHVLKKELYAPTYHKLVAKRYFFLFFST